MNTHTLPIIGHHHSPLSQKFGIPRQPNLVTVKSHITFLTPYGNPKAFVGIEKYSHLWILWLFHKNKIQDHFHPQVRPPRLGGNDKIGVFATRSMYRPSQIGLSVVQLDRIEVVDGQIVLHIIGADMADGTPILDIKPYLTFVDSIDDAISFDKPANQMVILTEHAKQDLRFCLENNHLNQEDEDIIKNLIAYDPRPAYRQHEIGILCSMRYKMVDVDFTMNKQREMVITQLRITA